jgi:hypothetical protein
MRGQPGFFYLDLIYAEAAKLFDRIVVRGMA